MTRQCFIKNGDQGREKCNHLNFSLCCFLLNSCIKLCKLCSSQLSYSVLVNRMPIKDTRCNGGKRFFCPLPFLKSLVVDLIKGLYLRCSGIDSSRGMIAVPV